MKRTHRRRAGIALLAIGAIVLQSCAGDLSLRRGSSHAFLLAPAPIDWKDTRWCVPPKLKRTLRAVSREFGAVRIHSTHRWPFENRRKGGKPKSYHLTCRAVDFSVEGDPDGVVEFLKARSEVGGYSRYPQGFYHIDTGPRRTW